MFFINNQETGTTYNRNYLNAGFFDTNITNMNRYEAWMGVNTFPSNPGKILNQQAAIKYGDGPYYVLVFYPNTVANGSENPVICASTTLPDDNPIQGYYVNIGNWEGDLYIYGTGLSNGVSKKMTATGKKYNGKNIYSFNLPIPDTHVRFCTDGEYKTDFITFGRANDGKMYNGEEWTSFHYDVKVTFNANGHGTAPDAQSFRDGLAPVKPNDPTAYGWEFGGWYENAECTGSPWNFATTLTEDKELFAKWTANIFTITWLNDDESLIDQTEVAYGEVPTHSEPTKEADAEYTYTFAGWTPEVVAVVGEATYTAQYTPKVNIAPVNAVIVLIAAIGEVEYTDECKAKIDAAREAYDALTNAQKALVTNYSTLTDAEDAYTALKEAAGEEREIAIRFVDSNKEQISSNSVVITVPAAPEIEGFTFLRWEIQSCELTDEIQIQALYEKITPTDAPTIYTNPANSAQKLIHNGNVYILTDEHAYTIIGQTVK